MILTLSFATGNAVAQSKEASFGREEYITADENVRSHVTDLVLIMMMSTLTTLSIKNSSISN